MSDPIIALVMLGLFIVFIFLGFPIAFTLMAMGIMFGAYAYYVPGQSIFDNNIFYLFTQNTFSVMNNDVLISIPLFLFMGYIIERANILDRLFESLQVSLRHVPGSMAVAALITCALFATATGIVGAVVTLMGLLALPSMLKAGYDQKLATGVIAAGGTLGILDTTVHHADCVRRNSWRFCGQVVCGRHGARHFARDALFGLRHHSRGSQSKVSAKAKKCRGRWFSSSGLDDRHSLFAFGGVDTHGSGLHPFRSCNTQ